MHSLGDNWRARLSWLKPDAIHRTATRLLYDHHAPWTRPNGSRFYCEIEDRVVAFHAQRRPIHVEKLSRMIGRCDLLPYGISTAVRNSLALRLHATAWLVDQEVGWTPIHSRQHLGIKVAMRIPKRIQPLVDDGLVSEVIRPLMSGKEADVYAVRCGDEIRCAKVYKRADKRGFKHAVQYREGRKVRNSRRARAMEKGSRFGRDQQEQAWQNTELNALYTLISAGVRVPHPYGCFDGVLLMELILDSEGHVAPRLSDISLSPEQARADHAVMMRYVTRMLCAGLVHGDLSEFNVLVDEQGPVIIDLPQVVNAAANNNAARFFARDVKNITAYYGLYAPELLETRYDGEIWSLFEAGELHPESELSGVHKENTRLADVDALLHEIETVKAEEMERLERLREAAQTD